jgi:hypothetical protein
MADTPTRKPKAVNFKPLALLGVGTMMPTASTSINQPVLNRIICIIWALIPPPHLS